jgi:hypothetical protein
VAGLQDNIESPSASRSHPVAEAGLAGDVVRTRHHLGYVCRRPMWWCRVERGLFRRVGSGTRTRRMWLPLHLRQLALVAPNQEGTGARPGLAVSPTEGRVPTTLPSTALLRPTWRPPVVPLDLVVHLTPPQSTRRTPCARIQRCLYTDRGPCCSLDVPEALPAPLGAQDAPPPPRAPSLYSDRTRLSYLMLHPHVQLAMDLSLHRAP